MGILKGVSWNLFLAMLPVLAAPILARSAELWRSRPSFLGALGLGSLALFWLAFLPNTCYLLTEWRHFLFDPPYIYARQVASSGNEEEKLRVLKHFFFFAAYSGCGLVSFAFAIRPVDRLIRHHWPRLTLLAFPFFLANSLGVYLGLVIRLNSWDLATRPMHVLSIASEVVSDTDILLLIIGFSGFLWLLYQMVDVWMDGLMLRFGLLKRRRAQTD